MNAEQQEAAGWDKFMEQVAAARASGALAGKVPTVLVLGKVKRAFDGQTLEVDATDVDLMVHASVGPMAASDALSEANRLMRRRYGR